MGVAERVAGLAIRARDRQLEVHVAAGEILDGRDLGKQLLETLAQEPLERVALDFDQVRDGRDLGDPSERVPSGTIRQSEGDRASLCERHGLTHTSVVRGEGRDDEPKRKTCQERHASTAARAGELCDIAWGLRQGDTGGIALKLDRGALAEPGSR